MAPRISHRLLDAIVRLDDRDVPIAETYRRVAAEAERIGLTRPSYQRVRELVHESRNLRPRLSVADVLRLVTSPLKGTDDGLARLEALGVRGIADWGGVPSSCRPP